MRTLTSPFCSCRLGLHTDISSATRHSVFSAVTYDHGDYRLNTPKQLARRVVVLSLIVSCFSGKITSMASQWKAKAWCLAPSETVLKTHSSCKLPQGTCYGLFSFCTFEHLSVPNLWLLFFTEHAPELFTPTAPMQICPCRLAHHLSSQLSHPSSDPAFMRCEETTHCLL